MIPKVYATLNDVTRFGRCDILIRSGEICELRSKWSRPKSVFTVLKFVL